mmetsp:Transcript_103157/g.188298  ORF Transcript_103157/g.188298 Transcript_103157/m.188298 type:complete len:355 (-) Transcript_103157:27-1091(-)
MHGATFLSTVILCALCSICGGSSISEYVLVSQPHTGKVLVTEVDALSRTVLSGPRGLVTHGLRKPMGLAVDHRRQRLFVADSERRKLFMYKLIYTDGEIAVDGRRHVAASGITPRWVAVDEETGSVFCSDEVHSAVGEVLGEDIKKLSHAGGHTPKFHVLYSPDTTLAVDGPSGIAVDGFHLFWGNKAHGRRLGSVVSGLEDAHGRARDVPGTVTALSNNADKVHGLCASGSTVFYTGESRFVYSARKGSHGHDTRILISNLDRPRGCAWDGDGTVYVADEGGRAVLSFPSSSHNRGRLRASKLFEVQGPYGIAVVRPPSSPSPATRHTVRSRSVVIGLPLATICMAILANLQL